MSIPNFFLRKMIKMFVDENIQFIFKYSLVDYNNATKVRLCKLQKLII